MECYLEKKSSNAKMKELMKNRKRVSLIKNLMAEYGLSKVSIYGYISCNINSEAHD